VSCAHCRGSRRHEETVRLTPDFLQAGTWVQVYWAYPHRRYGLLQEAGWISDQTRATSPEWIDQMVAGARKRLSRRAQFTFRRTYHSHRPVRGMRGK
jgi:hypothetical protein